jgi:hypothetical protein
MKSDDTNRNGNFEDLSPEEQIKAENELLKLQLLAETGVSFLKDQESKLEPEVENQWLKYIQQFEQNYQNAKQISVYEYIGKPDFELEDEISQENLENELNRLFDIMNNNGLRVDFICEYDVKTKYEFITKELYFHEIDDMRMEGMMTCFIYEEFHPNHDYDLRNHTDDFLKALLTRAWKDYDALYLNKELLNQNNQPVLDEEFIESIKLFQSAWKSFSVLKCDIFKVDFEIEKAKASVEFSLEYEALSEDNEAKIFIGRSIFQFIYKFDFWCLHKVSLPGFTY